MKSREIALMGIETALMIICNIFTVEIIPPYFIFSFVLVFSYIVGRIEGPYKAAIICFLGDLIGCIINPLGPYNPIVGLASATSGFIFGFLKNKECSRIKTLIYFLIVTIISTCFLNTLGLWLMYGYGKKTFFVYLLGRLPYQLINTVINGVFIALFGGNKNVKI